MAVKTFVLLDVDREIAESAWQTKPADVTGKASGCSVKKSTLRGGVREGVDIIEVNNGTFRLIVSPTRGMGIWKGWLGDFELGWRSPVRGPVHPNFVPVSEPSGLGWFDGFDELIVRCGLTSNGAPDFDAKTGQLIHPLHGMIANKPAHYVEVSIDDDSGEISVTGIVDESRFHFSKLRMKATIKIKPGERGFRVIDEVTNLSGHTGEMQLIYHINFGDSLIDEGSRIVAPVKTMSPCTAHAAKDVATWNVYPAEIPGYQEQVYLFDLAADAQGEVPVLLKNAKSSKGVSVKYPLKQLPYFTLWKDTATAADGYVTGLEPGTNYPNPRSFEEKQGRVVKLAPGETRRFEVTVEALPDAASVSTAEQAIEKITAGTKPTSFAKPEKGWTQV